MIDFIGNDIEKNTLYKNEIPYRMVCNMIKMYWPHQYKEKLRKYGLMIIKPEAIIMGKTSEIFYILHSAGYELIYFVRKKIDALRTSEMWKFSWVNTVTDLMSCHGFAHMNCHQIDWFSVISQPHRAAA